MCYKRPQLGPLRLMKTPFLPWFASVLLLTGNLPLIAATHYVDLNSPNPVAPYTSWATAATNIQDAVDAAVSGELVLVTNGIYATGGHKWVDSGTNRVTLTNSITLQSVNGPAVTWIVGARINGTGPILANAVRCVGIGGSAVLSGFTLTNGSGGWGNYPAGGGGGSRPDGYRSEPRHELHHHRLCCHQLNRRRGQPRQPGQLRPDPKLRQFWRRRVGL